MGCVGECAWADGFHREIRGVELGSLAGGIDQQGVLVGGIDHAVSRAVGGVGGVDVDFVQRRGLIEHTIRNFRHRGGKRDRSKERQILEGSFIYARHRSRHGVRLAGHLGGIADESRLRLVHQHAVEDSEVCVALGHGDTLQVGTLADGIPSHLRDAGGDVQVCQVIGGKGGSADGGHGLRNVNGGQSLAFEKGIRSDDAQRLLRQLQRRQR